MLNKSKQSSAIVKINGKEYAHREPLTSDVIFKAVFGKDNEESKELLMALLNIVLDREEDPIVNLEYKNPFSIKEAENEKYIIMDIRVETGKGENIDIEMQVGNLAYYKNRTVCYACDLVTKGLESGDDYDTMKKGIVISFIKGNLFPGADYFHSVYSICDRVTGEQLSDLLEIHYIELDKIQWQGRRVEELSPLEQIGAYMVVTNSRDKTAEMMELLEALVKEGEGVISMTDKVLTKVSEDERLRHLRFSRQMWQMQEAMERRAVLEEERSRIVRNLKNNGVPEAVIAKSLGITEEEVEKM